MSVVTKPEPPPAAPHDTTHLGHLLHIRRGMGVAEAFRVAFEGLMANKMRSFLTMRRQSSSGCPRSS